jgi:outer membrane protein assembly factor BamB
MALLLASVPLMLRADDWPQWMGPGRDNVWRETGILRSFPEGGPKIVWRRPIAGGYAGPAVAQGRVYVHDYLTDADARRLSNPGARARVQGKERVLCLDAATGELVWKYEYDCPYNISYPAGPRCTPVVQEGKVWTLGAEGDLYCFQAADGKVLWHKNLKSAYNTPAPMWGFCSHPLIDGKKLITLAGGDGSVAVALDKDTGQEIWRALSAREPGYCPPVIIEHGGRRQLIIWHSEAICSLDPETASLYWEIPLKPNYGMSISAPRLSGDYLFAGGIGNVCACIKLSPDRPAAEVVWRGDRDTGVYPANSTPHLENDIIYACDCQVGSLRAVQLTDGKRLWETFGPTTGRGRGSHGTAFLVKQGDRFFLFSETGHLILARLSPTGYEEIGRVKILEPTGSWSGRDVVWSAPAFANKCCFARNDKEIVCVSLAAE